MKRNATPTSVVIGAGMSGLCMGSTLLNAGIDTFAIYESAHDVGGRNGALQRAVTATGSTHAPT